MKSLLKHIHTRSSKELSFVAQMTGGVAVLLLVAAFIAGNGMETVNRLLVAYNIVPGSQTACVFPCSSTAYELQALIPESSQGVSASTFQPNQTIRFQWNAGTYGANTFSHVCQGGTSGTAYVCNVSFGSPNTNFSGCVPAGTCTGTVGCSSDKYGNTMCSCSTGKYTASPSNCGNADEYWGSTCFGPGGGTTPSCPGYYGNWNDSPSVSSYFTAPATAGTYAYYFCSYWLMHANSFNGNLSNLPCLAVNITVASTCTNTGFSSPWNTSSYLILSGGSGTISNWYGRYCVRNFSSNAIYVPMNSPGEWNNFASAAAGLGVSVSAY